MALGHEARCLSEEEARAFIERDADCVSSFKQDKLEKEAKKNWDLFYKRNSTHFFKDRHWITREFPEVLETIAEVGVARPVLLEAGCGVGNTVRPLLEENPNLFIYACDFSPRAITYIKSDPSYNEATCIAFECDLTKDDLCGVVPSMTVDLALLIFVLSAISPDKMTFVLSNIFKVLKPGGLVLFRDYGLYDHAMLRFAKGHKISENFYVRQDGTRAYYFSQERVNELFTSTGYIVIENRYIKRETVNHKEGINAQRIFVQGKFKKPQEEIDCR